MVGKRGGSVFVFFFKVVVVVVVLVLLLLLSLLLLLLLEYPRLYGRTWIFGNTRVERSPYFFVVSI